MPPASQFKYPLKLYQHEISLGINMRMQAFSGVDCSLVRRARQNAIALPNGEVATAHSASVPWELRGLPRHRALTIFITRCRALTKGLAMMQLECARASRDLKASHANDVRCCYFGMLQGS